jgi:hypothetical protein
MATFALADPRIDHVQAAWNRGDIYAVQENFAGAGIASQARLAHAAEQGGTLTLGPVVKLADRFYGVLAMHNGLAETWVFVECEDSTVWCGWGSRPAAGIMGGAETGQGLDLATTAVGVGFMGATELNPLGWALFPIKMGITAWSRTADYHECVSWRSSLDSFGMGAGVANIAALIAGIANPVIPVVVALAGTLWRYEDATETAYFECAGFALGSAHP